MSQSTDFDRIARTSLFFLGHQPGDRTQPIAYPKKHRPHLAYYGTTDSGKSFAIEYALEQLARERSAGFCVIDPHGSLYWRLASYLRQHSITDRVLFWDLNDPEFVVTYDPFALHKIPAPAIAAGLTKALLGTLGDKGLAVSDQPLLKTLTDTGLRMLIETKLPFLLCRELFDPTETQVKRGVAARLEQLATSDHRAAVASLLTAVSLLPNMIERFHQLVPTYRRIDNVFSTDQLRLSFSQEGLDFKQLMEEGRLVLVNVANTRQDAEAAYTFTRLLVSHLLSAAKDRDPTKDLLPFFLAIDEASRYLSRDVADVLTQARKFGVHLMAGMQGLEQAKLEDAYTYLALRECTGAEVVMKILDSDEKQFWAKRFFEDSLTFRLVKRVRTNVIPEMIEESYTVDVHGTNSGQSVRFAAGGEYDPGTDPTTEHSSESSSQITGSRWRTEYRYEDDPEYYSGEEELQFYARWFSQRDTGKEQRFGVSRVHDLRSRIEVPELPSALYSPQEMTGWLSSFKVSQPATLPMAEAEKRYQQLRLTHLGELQELAAPVASKSRRKSTTEFSWK